MNLPEKVSLGQLPTVSCDRVSPCHWLSESTHAFKQSSELIGQVAVMALVLGAVQDLDLDLIREVSVGLDGVDQRFENLGYTPTSAPACAAQANALTSRAAGEEGQLASAEQGDGRRKFVTEQPGLECGRLLVCAIRSAGKTNWRDPIRTRIVLVLTAGNEQDSGYFLERDVGVGAILNALMLMSCWVY
jgi:hypothetical protein